jgi:hypothetical protein
MKNLPTMKAVTSSNIESIGHCGQHLCVKFKSGGIHRFHDVPPELFDKMQSAESAGKFFHAHIRGQFESKKLEIE